MDHVDYCRPLPGSLHDNTSCIADISAEECATTCFTLGVTPLVDSNTDLEVDGGITVLDDKKKFKGSRNCFLCNKTYASQ